MRIAICALLLVLCSFAYSIETSCIPGGASQGCTSGGGSSSGGSGGTGGSTTCTVTTYCYDGSVLVGTISCTGTICARENNYVACDGQRTYC